MKLQKSYHIWIYLTSSHTFCKWQCKWWFLSTNQIAWLINALQDKKVWHLKRDWVTLSALVFMVLIWTGQRITTFNQLELFVLICIEDWGKKKIYCLTISFFLVLFALQESNIFLSTDWVQWLHKMAREASTAPLEVCSLCSEATEQYCWGNGVPWYIIPTAAMMNQHLKFTWNNSGLWWLW